MDTNLKVQSKPEMSQSAALALEVLKCSYRLKSQSAALTSKCIQPDSFNRTRLTGLVWEVDPNH